MKLTGNRFKKDKKTLYGTFKNAFEGISYTYNTEMNFKSHIISTVAVLLGSYILEVSLFELIVCLLLIGLVMTLELINTAIEVVVDMVEPNFNPLAKVAKDVAAGAVLMMSMTSFVIGLIVFVPKILIYVGLV